MKKPFQLKTHVGLSRNPHTLPAVSVQMKSHSGFLRAVVWLEKVEEKQADKEWCFWGIGLCACCSEIFFLDKIDDHWEGWSPICSIGRKSFFFARDFYFYFSLLKKKKKNHLYVRIFYYIFSNVL